MGVVQTGRNQGHGINFLIDPKDPQVIAFLKRRSWFEKLDTIGTWLPSWFGKKVLKLPLLWIQTNWAPRELQSYLSNFLPADLISEPLVDENTRSSFLIKNWRMRLAIGAPFCFAYLIMLFKFQ